MVRKYFSNECILRFKERYVEDIAVLSLFVVMTFSAVLVGHFFGFVMGKRS